MKTRKEAPLEDNPGRREKGRVDALAARLREAEGALAEAVQAETRREAYLAELKGAYEALKAETMRGPARRKRRARVWPPPSRKPPKVLP